AARRFLRHFQPQLGLVLETELWPNLLAVCARRGIPVLLVNARLSQRSAARYARFATLTRDSLRHLTMTGAQSENDATRLRALGALDADKISVTGNMKFDVLPASEKIAAGITLRADMGARPVLLAASTREGEEALLLERFLARAPADA